MRFFIKLNVLSALYGFLFFLTSTILARPYQITEFMNISLNALAIGFVCLFILGAITLGILIPILTEKWMNGRVAALWATILWFPYWFLFVLFIGFLFPNPNPYDEDNYGAGFLIMGLIFAYPFYLALTIFLGIRNNEKNKR